MAKVKVSILAPERRWIDVLGGFTPIYNREIESKLLVPYVRDGWSVVAADDLKPYVFDATSNDVKKGGTASAVSPGGTSGGTTGGGGPSPIPGIGG